MSDDLSVEDFYKIRATTNSRGKWASFAVTLAEGVPKIVLSNVDRKEAYAPRMSIKKALTNIYKGRPLPTIEYAVKPVNEDGGDDGKVDLWILIGGIRSGGVSPITPARGERAGGSTESSTHPSAHPSSNRGEKPNPNRPILPARQTRAETVDEIQAGGPCMKDGCPALVFDSGDGLVCTAGHKHEKPAGA